MRVPIVALMVNSLVLTVASGGVSAAEPIGKTVNARPALRAQGAEGSRTLNKGSDVYFMERLTTSGSGSGEFVFSDGTRLAISPSSRITIDASIVQGGSRFKKLGIKAASGSFRWISGKTPSTAYRIQTPTASMAIRGTAFDVTVRNGKTYVVLLNGSGQLCAGGKCQRLRSSCDVAISSGGSVTKTLPINEAFKKREDAARLFPFLANSRTVSSRFRVTGGNCLSKFKNATLRRRGIDKGGEPGQGSPASEPARQQSSPSSPPPPPPPPPPPSSAARRGWGRRRGAAAQALSCRRMSIFKAGVSQSARVQIMALGSQDSGVNQFTPPLLDRRSPVSAI